MDGHMIGAGRCCTKSRSDQSFGYGVHLPGFGMVTSALSDFTSSGLVNIDNTIRAYAHCRTVYIRHGEACNGQRALRWTFKPWHPQWPAPQMHEAVSRRTRQSSLLGGKMVFLKSQ